MGMLGQLRDSGVFADSVQLTVDNSFMPQLMQMVSHQRQQVSRDRQLLGEVMQSAVEERVEKQRKVLEVEKRRLATIDDAERQARVEIAENRERAKEEELRMQAEKAIVFTNEDKVQLSPEWGDERIDELKAALNPENLEGGKCVMATKVPGPEEAVFYLGEFRVAEPTPPADDAEAPADA